MSTGILSALGIFVGFGIGLYTRDNYLYSMSEKMDDIHKDYEGINSRAIQRLKEQALNVEILRERVQNVERDYLRIKERVIAGEDEEEIFGAKGQQGGAGGKGGKGEGRGKGKG